MPPTSVGWWLWMAWESSRKWHQIAFKESFTYTLEVENWECKLILAILNVLGHLYPSRYFLHLSPLFIVTAAFFWRTTQHGSAWLQEALHLDGWKWTIWELCKIGFPKTPVVFVLACFYIKKIGGAQKMSKLSRQETPNSVGAWEENVDDDDEDEDEDEDEDDDNAEDEVEDEKVVDDDVEGRKWWWWCFGGDHVGEEDRSQDRDPHFEGPCVIEMQVNMSQEPLYTEIYRKSAAAQLEHPDQAPAFTPTVRTPQLGHTVWGKKLFEVRLPTPHRSGAVVSVVSAAGTPQQQPLLGGTVVWFWAYRYITKIMGFRVIYILYCIIYSIFIWFKFYMYNYIVWDREMGQSWAGPTKLVKLGHFEHDITKIWGSVDSFDPHSFFDLGVLSESVPWASPRITEKLYEIVGMPTIPAITCRTSCEPQAHFEDL